MWGWEKTWVPVLETYSELKPKAVQEREGLGPTNREAMVEGVLPMIQLPRGELEGLNVSQFGHVTFAIQVRAMPDRSLQDLLYPSEALC